MKTALVAFSLSLFAQVANAGIPGLTGIYQMSLQSAQQAILSSGALVERQPATCDSQVVNLVKDGQINIFLAFGYMDVSGGQDFGDSGASMYTNGNTLDADAKEAMEQVLLSACPSGSGGARANACGFSRSGGYLQKRIRDRFSGNSVQVNIRLEAPSLTSDDSQNHLNPQQAARSQEVRRDFLSALTTDDVVLYMGHARSGGGPDFFPPILLGNGHVDYSVYRSRKEGIGSLLSALGSVRTPPAILGVLACKSTGLFSTSIRRRAPGSALVTAGELFDYNDILPTGYAIVEAVVSQRCSDQFTTAVKVRPTSSRFLDIFF